MKFQFCKFFDELDFQNNKEGSLEGFSLSESAEESMIQIFNEF